MYAKEKRLDCYFTSFKATLSSLMTDLAGGICPWPSAIRTACDGCISGTRKTITLLHCFLVGPVSFHIQIPGLWHRVVTCHLHFNTIAGRSAILVWYGAHKTSRGCPYDTQWYENLSALRPDPQKQSNEVPETQNSVSNEQCHSGVWLVYTYYVHEDIVSTTDV